MGAGLIIASALFPPATGVLGLMAVGVGGYLGFESGASSQAPGDINGVGDFAASMTQGAVSGVKSAAPVVALAPLVGSTAPPPTPADSESTPTQRDASEKYQARCDTKHLHDRDAANTRTLPLPDGNDASRQIQNLPLPMEGHRRGHGGHWGIAGPSLMKACDSGSSSTSYNHHPQAPNTTRLQAARELYNSTNDLPPKFNTGDDLNFPQCVPDPHSREYIGAALERQTKAQAEMNRHNDTRNQRR